MVTVAIKPTFSHISPLRWTAAPSGLTANFDLNGTLIFKNGEEYKKIIIIVDVVDSLN